MRITYSNTAYVTATDSVIDTIESTLCYSTTGTGIVSVDIADLRDGVENENEWEKDKNVHKFLKEVLKKVEKKRPTVGSIVFVN